MAKFLTKLRLDTTTGGWLYAERFEYQSDYLDTVVSVPPGEFTDLASIPKAVPRWVFDVANGPTREPACVHDPLCRDEYKVIYGISQHDADRVLLEAMKANGMSWYARWTVYSAVVAFQLAKHRQNYWKKP